LDRVDDRLGHRRVGRHRKHTPAAGKCNIVRSPPQRILGPRHHRDVTAFARQFFRDGSSDPIPIDMSVIGGEADVARLS